MINEIQQLIDQYLAWLKDRTVLRQVDDWVEITTPYLDRHNDYLQIFTKREGDDFVIHDDGYIIADLVQSGCPLDSPKRKRLLEITVNGFGVALCDGALTVHSNSSNFAVRKHNLVQAMLAVNDLFYLATPNVASLFAEDVARWLDLCQVRYTPKIKFSGTSGYDHMFDFVIPKSQSHVERVLRAVNHPSRESAQVLAFSWIDTRQTRSPNSRVYAVLNDSRGAISSDVMSALRSYQVTPVPWSLRKSVEQELAA